MATAAFKKYLRKAADVCELRDWEFRLDDEPCEEGAEASIHVVYGRKIGVIHLSAEWSEKPARERRHVIVHELMHCHFGAASSMVENDLHPELSSGACRVFCDGFTRQLEYGIDAVAMAIAKHLPMPPD